MNLKLNSIYQGNALNVLQGFPPESIDTIVMSPPYYGLRVYKTEPQIWDGEESCEHDWGTVLIKEMRRQAGKGNTGNHRKILDGGLKQEQGQFCLKCGAWRGELGSEPTIELYLDHLFQIMDECYRVLKKTGTMWVNIGDSYGGSGGSTGHTSKTKNLGRKTFDYGAYPSYANTKKYKAKSLLQIPSRFSIGMTDRGGWILRNELIWWKPNCIPYPGKDRFTVDFEKLFFYTKRGKYFFNQQFEPYTEPLDRWGGQGLKAKEGGGKWDEGTGQELYRDRDMRPDPRGRNKRTVWRINPSVYNGAHFAVFPEGLIEPIIDAGCPEYVCDKCGKLRRKILEFQKPPDDVFTNTNVDKESDQEDLIYKSRRNGKKVGYGQKYFDWVKEHPPIFKGYTDCGCSAGFHPGVVLDPFAGAGTTGVVANKLERDFVLIELSKKYIKLIEDRFDDELALFNNLIKDEE